METINIIDKEKEDQIKDQARNFANSVISQSYHDNWQTIYEQQREILSMTEGQSQINLDMMKREKKREAQHRDEVNQLKDQVERLAQLVGKLSKKA
jgi:ubiquinone biosynthesis protein UbiJ